MAFLKPDKVYTKYGLEISEKLITASSGVRYYSNRKLNTAGNKPEYITIHNTADINEAAGTNDAEQYSRATYNNAMGEVVVHYYLDETACWHILANDTVGWHAGDGTNGTGNTKSIAIEIIMDGSGSKSDTEAETRGALLAAILLYEYNLPIEKMVPHKTWNGKQCPVYILPHWNKFVEKVKTNLANIKKQNEPEKPTTLQLYRIRKTWEDATTQIGAFVNLDKAIDYCDKAGSAYSVFDPNGVKVYPKEEVKFKVGDIITLSTDAKYINNTSIPSWVLNSTLYVRKIDDNKITFSTLKTGDITGVVDVKYIKSFKTDFTPYIVKITANKLNVRKAPNTTAAVVTILSKDSAYTIIEEKGDWGLLKSFAEKKDGWINLAYTEKI